MRSLSCIHIHVGSFSRRAPACSAVQNCAAAAAAQRCLCHVMQQPLPAREKKTFEILTIKLKSRALDSRAAACACGGGVGGGGGWKAAGLGDAHGFHTGQHVVEGLVMLLLLLLLLLLLPGKFSAQSLVVLNYFLDQLHRDEVGRHIHTLHTLTHAHTDTHARAHARTLTHAHTCIIMKFVLA